MTATFITTRPSFDSRGVRVAAWLTLPAGDGPHPGIVLAHGLGATHGMMMAQYEQHFAANGIATLTFDYRHTGESDGTPRRLITMRRQLQDVQAAHAYLSARPEIDPRRVGLWGTSLGAMHVLRAATTNPNVAAAVVQCPIVHGPSAALSSGLAHALRLTPAITSDLVRAALRLPRRYVPIVGQPGSDAVVTVPGAEEGWNGTVSPGFTFTNKITAASALGLAAVSALRGAASITAPLLVCVSDHETLMDPRLAARAAALAPRGSARHYPGDHFEIYHAPLAAGLLADQTAFLTEYLDVAA
jgi:pimeloyl-ACP methyl ester carboxylesterase